MHAFACAFTGPTFAHALTLVYGALLAPGRRTVASALRSVGLDGEPPVPIRWVLLRDPTGKLKPTVLGCTDQGATPLQIVGWYVGRWNIEVTFEESRYYLGVETQRQWSRRAVERTMPCLLGLVSLVALMAHALHGAAVPTRQAAWYAKPEATFADALAAVRRHLWARSLTNGTPAGCGPNTANSPAPLLASLLEVACYAT